MNSINATQAAIITALSANPGVSVEAYAGQFSAMDFRRVLVKAPSILVDFAAGTVSTDTGTGEIDIACQFGAYCITRLANDLHHRNQSAHALAQEVALLAAFNRWGLTKVQAPTDIKLKPINSPVFADNAVGVVVVSWTQIIRVGTSVWEGGERPTEVWLGLSPEIGTAFANQYQQVTP